MSAGPLPGMEPLLEVLGQTAALTLATVEPDGSPRATPLYFAFDEDAAVLFLTDPDTAHGRNLQRSPLAAVGAYPETDDWREIRGVQMKGRVEPVPAEAAESAGRLYRARFPWADQVPADLAGMRLYRFRPAWARLIDNRRGFGFRLEWNFP